LGARDPVSQAFTAAALTPTRWPNSACE
jgi:hypothetical protein